MNCPACDTDVKSSQFECPNCGAVLGKPTPQLPICPACGTQNPFEARYCLQCGRALIEEVSEIEETSEPSASEETESEPPERVEPVVSRPPREKAQLASGIKTSSIIVAIGGFLVLCCCCVLFPMGYDMIRSINNALSPADNLTQPVLISPAKTKPPATNRPTSTASATFTALPTVTDAPINTPRPTATIISSQPFGKIVFSCQMTGEENHDQVCIVNADGTGWRQLTDNGKHNWYASISPAGQSVVYSSNANGRYQIYEISVYGGMPVRLNYDLDANLYAPEISPDGKKIVFTHDENKNQSIWVMDRDGSNPYRVSQREGWDPSWSADGKLILFASYGSNASVQLFTMQENGTNEKQITNMSGLIGRSDLSPSGESVATYAGKYGARSIYLISLNGGETVKYFFKPTSAAPSFSPDGHWMAFTGYIDHPNDFENGCEIYIVRLDDPGNPIRLTENNYCDWQPRWGQ